jgi:multidrug efflux pump subunit AcrA (membrane-fusion protein)
MDAATSKKRILILGLTGPVALAVLVAVALATALTASTLSRMRQQHKRKATAEAAAAMPEVAVVRARSMASEVEQVLSGSSTPLLEAGLYPRATGYIMRRLVDSGDRVQKGQVLAVIDAPDLDDQLALAKANLAQAKANWEKAKADAELSRSVENRYRVLLSGGEGSESEYQIKFKTHGADKAAVGALEAAIKVNEAAVQRFTDRQTLKKIVAPFPGVITAQRINPGDLVSAAPRVAVLDDQHRVQYRTVQVGRDHGANVEVLAGLTAGDAIVVHPGDLLEGTVVDPVRQQPVAR